MYLVSLLSHFVLCVGDFTVSMARSAGAEGLASNPKWGKTLSEETLALDKLPSHLTYSAVGHEFSVNQYIKYK